MSGSYKTQSKVLPGVYVNFMASRALTIEMQERGTVLLPLKGDMGRRGEVTEVTAQTDTRALLGHAAAELTPLREALKNAGTVLVYHLNKGTNAKATPVSGVTLTAKRPGSRGNEISVTVAKTENGFEVKIYLAGSLLEEWAVSDYGGLQESELVTFAGSGAMSAFSCKLSGGTDTDVTEEDFASFLSDAKRMYFQTLAYPYGDEAAKEKLVAFAREMREEEGKRIQVVLADKAADYEGVISVRSGVMLQDGTTVSCEEACAYVAGMTAGAAVNESRTNHTYEGAVDVLAAMTKAEKEKAIKAGHMIFTADGNGRVSVVYDINTKVSGDESMGADARKNRVLRVLDGIHNDIVSIFEGGYMGKISNDGNGRSLLRGSLIEYFNRLEELGAIADFDNGDLTVGEGSDSDSVVITVNVAPVDSCEKFYITVNVG